MYLNLELVNLSWDRLTSSRDDRYDFFIVDHIWPRRSWPTMSSSCKNGLQYWWSRVPMMYAAKWPILHRRSDILYQYFKFMTSYCKPTMSIQNYYITLVNLTDAYSVPCLWCGDVYGDITWLRVKKRQPVLHWIVVWMYGIFIWSLPRMILLIHLIPCIEFLVKGLVGAKNWNQNSTDLNRDQDWATGYHCSPFPYIGCNPILDALGWY